MRIGLFCLILAGALPFPAMAQSPGAPGVVTGGADGVTFNGKPAARQGDATSDGSMIVQGSPNVFINGKPDAVSSDRTGCGGVVNGGGNGIFINGKPVARAGDQTSGCPAK